MDVLWWVEKVWIPGLAFGGGWLIRMQSQVDKAATSADLAEVRKHMDTNVNMLRDDLMNAKLAAAREYVPNSRIESIEEKIERRFDRLEEKLDGLLARR